jgi:hypothetical protein
VDGARRSPGFASKDVDDAGTSVIARGLPGITPSGREQFPRSQLRGSAGLAPASLSLPSGKDARSERR